jgi:hypothetical protein
MRHSRRVDCVEKHMQLIETHRRERIRELNDALRTSMDPKRGTILLTAGVDGLPSDVRAMAIRKTATFDAFTPDDGSRAASTISAASNSPAGPSSSKSTTTRPEWSADRKTPRTRRRRPAS